MGNWGELRLMAGSYLFFMDIFISYLFFIHDSNRNGWIEENAAKVCSSQCKDFLSGKQVYYSL
ncbi:hypothetical protein D3C80_1530580 [compost metagenome]